jgi:hypothetical protein
LLILLGSFGGSMTMFATACVGDDPTPTSTSHDAPNTPDGAGEAQATEAGPDAGLDALSDREEAATTSPCDSCVLLAMAARDIRDLVVAGDKLYFLADDGTLGVVPTAGGGAVTTIVQGSAAIAASGTLVVDGDTVLFTTQSDRWKIQRVGIGGGAAADVYASAGSDMDKPIKSMVVTSDTVAWTNANGGKVYTCSKTSCTTPKLAAGGYTMTSGIARDGSGAYVWGMNHGLGSCSATTTVPVGCDGLTYTALETGANVSAVVVANGTEIFFTELGSVRRTTTGGAAAETRVTAKDVAGLAVDATHLYFTSAHDVARAPIAGGTPTSLAKGSSDVVRLDESAIYFASRSGVYRRPK